MWSWSGDCKPSAKGKLPPVGNTVDVACATWTNTIGAPDGDRLGETWAAKRPEKTRKKMIRSDQ